MSSTSETATIEIIRLALNATTLRHAIHAQNIANASVDGYVKPHVIFEEHLGIVREQLLRGQLIGSEISLPQPVLETEKVLTDSKVELDTEVAAMSKNALHYQALLKVLSKQLSLTAIAVGGGRA